MAFYGWLSVFSSHFWSAGIFLFGSWKKKITWDHMVSMNYACMGFEPVVVSDSQRGDWKHLTAIYEP